MKPIVAGCVRTGHFVYESGDHGDTWLRLEALLVEPEPMRRIVVGLTAALALHRPDVVCGPETGGARFARRVAEALGARFVAAERHGAGHEPPTYRIPDVHRASLAGAQVGVVDDAINAGYAVAACVDAIAALGGKVVVVAAAILRASAQLELERRFGCGITALYELPFHTWPEPECPLCRAGRPITRRAD